jgi:Ca2+-binding RTX toxin-like protein
MLALQPGEHDVTGTHQYLDDNPTGTPSDDYTIHVTVEDNDGDADSGSLTLTVLNVAPILSEISASNAVENGVSTLRGTITDPGTLDAFELVVDWGDGSTSEVFSYPAGRTSFSEIHQYLDDNPSGTAADQYNITVSVIDDDGGEDSAGTTLTVSNLAPEITALVSSATEVGDAGPGDGVTVSGLFTDLGSMDTHTALIHWGDGTVTPAVIDQAAKSFSATHVYTTGGIFDIQVILSDDDLGSAEARTTALVTGARVKDGELQVVGTHGRDWVSINKVCRKYYKVRADFLPGRRHYLTFNESDVERIKILLGDGNDHAHIAGNIDVTVTMDGGAGNDHLNAGRGPTVLIGGDGDDKLMGGRGDDQIYGGAGNDVILGGGGHDWLNGGSGDDRLFGSCGDDVILGGDGDDWIFGDGGNDILDGGAGNDIVMGGRGDDEISGGEGHDRLFGGSGNDLLAGGSGDDWLFGESGHDELSGGEGNDWLIGGPGCDTLDGGDGLDRLLEPRRCFSRFAYYAFRACFGRGHFFFFCSFGY